MATLLVKFTNESQYNSTSASITYTDPGRQRWIDVYSKLKVGDNCIFHSAADNLYIGDFASSVPNTSVTFNKITVVKISLDDLLRISELEPETIAVFKRPPGPILKDPTIKVKTVYNAAMAKQFVSFYIIKQGKEVEILPSLKENDRVIIIDESNRIIELFLIINGTLQVRSFGIGLFGAKGNTLEDILRLMTNAGKPNHVKNIQRVIAELAKSNLYKFPSFNDYYNIMHNKRLYSNNPPIAGTAGNQPDDDFENDQDDSSPLNMILYGPPGTGKTFHSISYAVAIVEDKDPEIVIEEANNDRLPVKKRFDDYVNKGLIVFTTFHQSMSYEDFIEGIKPLPPEKDQDIKYDIQDGIFKMLCNNAESNWFSSKHNDISSFSFETIFEEFQEQWESKKAMKIAMKTRGKEFTITGFTNKSIHFKKANGGEGHTLSINTLKDIYYGKREAWENGVGIYYPGIIEKLKSITAGSKVEETKVNNYVIIIDEINRGNVSQIFGELITLIEDDKRIDGQEALKITLPYSKDQFGVPPNLFIVGTMNTADRSVEALDTALRRRFSFIPKMPEENKLSKTNDGISLSQLLQTINNRLSVLKDIDHTIGHAWFWNVTDMNSLKIVFANKILPLLQEYFYNDYEKLGLVLGDAFFKPYRQVNSNIFASFTGGDGLAGQYDQTWQYQLKSINELTIADFKSLEQQNHQPAFDEGQ